MRRLNYILPDLVFWNVDSRHEQQPVKRMTAVLRWFPATAPDLLYGHGWRAESRMTSC